MSSEMSIVLKAGQFVFCPAVEREEKGTGVTEVSGIYAIPGGGYASIDQIEKWAANYNLKVKRVAM